MLPKFSDKNYIKNSGIYFTDKIVSFLFLWAIPKSITPNQITLIRFILILPVFILIYLKNYTLGLPLFIIAALTDAVDGTLARTRNMITTWGRIFDPVADKLLIVPVGLVLISNHLSLWLALALMSVELIIIIAAWFWRNSGRVVQANVWGKLKMVCEVVALLILILAIIFHLSFLFPVAFGLIVVSIILAIISLLRYGI